MPLTHLTLDELQQHAAAKPDDPELVAEVMARFVAGGLVSAEEAEVYEDAARQDGFEQGLRAAQMEYNGGYSDGYDGYDAGFEEGLRAAQMEYDGGYSDGYDAGFEEGFNKASGRIA